MPPLSSYREAFAQLALAVAQDQELIEHLKKAFIPEERAHFVAGLERLFPQELRPLVKDLWRAFTSHCA